MRTNKLAWFLSYVISTILVIGIAIVVIDAMGREKSNQIKLTVGQEIVVPEGYTFVDASAFGKISAYVTYYCKEDASGRIFVCTDGVIGKEIVIPEGYTFVGASASGEISSYATYYCMHNASGRVYICDAVE